MVQRELALLLCLSATMILGSLMVLGSPIFAGIGHIVTPDQTIPPGATFDATISIDTDYDTSGFSYGLCDPDGAFAVTAVNEGPAFEEAGFAPEFFAATIDPSPGEAGEHTVGCVYSFSGQEILPAGTRAVVVASFVLLDDALTDCGSGGGHPLAFCDFLGTPPVFTTIFDTFGLGIIPLIDDGCITVAILCDDPLLTVLVDCVDLDISVEAAEDYDDMYIMVVGNSSGQVFSQSYGPTPAGPVVNVNLQGLATDTYHVETQALCANGNVTNMVQQEFDVVGCGCDDPILTVLVDCVELDISVEATENYDDLTIVVAGDSSGLVFFQSYGPTTAGTVINVNLQGLATDTYLVGTQALCSNGDVTNLVEQILDVVACADFIRGDCNGDGSIGIADPIFNLAYQFAGGPAPCLDAHDTNDDGAVDLADPVFNLNYLFASGPPPPEPFAVCGSDPTPTPNFLICDTFAGCP